MGSRNFRLLLGCDVVSMAGTSIALVAIPFAVLSIGGSGTDVGFVATAALVPMIVFLLLGGVLADRLPRHQVIVAADALQGTAQAVAAVLVLTGTARLWELLVLSALRGTGMGFYYPAATGLLPQTVAAGQRASANAIDRFGRNGAQIGGTALGGIIVGLAGPGWGLAADAASFAVAVGLRAGMRFSGPARSKAPGESGASGASGATGASGVRHELREGWQEFASRRWLWAIVLQFAGLTAVVSATTGVLGPVVADASLGGARSWGFILAADGAGAVLGGLVMVALRPARMLLVATVAVLVSSVLIFALAVPLTVPLVAAAGFVTGVCSELFAVNWITTMQQEIPPGAMSRVSAYDALGSFALAPVGTVIAGPLLAAYGARTVLAAGGGLVVLFTVAVLAVPEVRQLRRQPAIAVAATAPVSGSGH
jgi:MFS family permease